MTECVHVPCRFSGDEDGVRLSVDCSIASSTLRSEKCLSFSGDAVEDEVEP